MPVKRDQPDSSPHLTVKRRNRRVDLRRTPAHRREQDGVFADRRTSGWFRPDRSPRQRQVRSGRSPNDHAACSPTGAVVACTETRTPTCCPIAFRIVARLAARGLPRSLSMRGCRTIGRPDVVAQHVVQQPAAVIPGEEELPLRVGRLGPSRRQHVRERYRGGRRREGAAARAHDTHHRLAVADVVVQLAQRGVGVLRKIALHRDVQLAGAQAGGELVTRGLKLTADGREEESELRHAEQNGTMRGRKESVSMGRHSCVPTAAHPRGAVASTSDQVRGRLPPRERAGEVYARDQIAM